MKTLTHAQVVADSNTQVCSMRQDSLGKTCVAIDVRMTYTYFGFVNKSPFSDRTLVFVHSHDTIRHGDACAAPTGELYWAYVAGLGGGVRGADALQGRRR